MPSEEAKENERRSDFFREVQAGRRDKVEAILNGRPPEDFRGTVYSWVTLENIERRTAFLLAAEAGHLDVMRLLQQRGANIHAVDTGGDTALHAAAEAGHMEVMTTLISEGVNINAQSKRGMTPLYRATATKGQRQAMIALIQLRARVDLADNTDTTPLMVAAKNNNYDAASILLACGASIHKADKSGHNAMDHSQQRMLQLLWFHAARQGARLRALRSARASLHRSRLGAPLSARDAYICIGCLSVRVCAFARVACASPRTHPIPCR